MENGKTPYRFVARIAGHRFGICSSAEETRQAFAAFITEDGEEPELVVRISPEEVARRKNQGIRDPWMLLRLDLISRYLLTKEVLHLHASAVRYQDRAWLFTAPSGGGKSTHAALWREVLGEDAVMINDDKPYLRFEEGRILVCGSPWMGRYQLGGDVEAPLAGICQIRKGTGNTIRRMTVDEAFFHLAGQVYIWDDAADTRHIFRLIDRLVREAPVFTLSCDTTREAAETSIRAMTEIGLRDGSAVYPPNGGRA